MKKYSEINLVYIGSYLFLIGSGIFTLDAILEIARANSILSIINFVGCLLFTVGSLFFLYSSRSKD